MVHGSGRVALVYFAGVIAGSLGTSVFDDDVYLVGASGGVYALLAAHLANVVLNYNNMQCGVLRLLGIFAIGKFISHPLDISISQLLTQTKISNYLFSVSASCDVGYAIYTRYADDPLGLSVSYVAHLTGALAGLTIGLIVLKNFEQKLHEQLLWWVALGVYAACTIFAILFNIMKPTVEKRQIDGIESHYIMYNKLGV